MFLRPCAAKCTGVVCTVTKFFILLNKVSYLCYDCSEEALLFRSYYSAGDIAEAQVDSDEEYVFMGGFEIWKDRESMLHTSELIHMGAV